MLDVIGNPNDGQLRQKKPADRGATFLQAFL